MHQRDTRGSEFFVGLSFREMRGSEFSGSEVLVWMSEFLTHPSSLGVSSFDSVVVS